MIGLNFNIKSTHEFYTIHTDGFNFYGFAFGTAFCANNCKK